uniref:Protein kinase domain-containing protein n=1 Tax=Takifugu rubripes TaxID=31033 RepID=A0A674P5Z4_TAKRU
RSKQTKPTNQNPPRPTLNGFGHVWVVQCKNLGSDKKLAVMIVYQYSSRLKELAILKEFTELDEAKNNLVKCGDHFVMKRDFCLVFELLDKSLCDFMKKRCYLSLRVAEIRVVTQQMLVTLNALKHIGVIHCDIKPDNITLVNHTALSFKIQLSDFGLAQKVSKIIQGTKVQALGYRAPELFLGFPYNEAIDMWFLGCVMAYLYTGKHLYQTGSEYESIRLMVTLFGNPDVNLDFTTPGMFWKLKTQSGHSSFTARIHKSAETFTRPEDLDTHCKQEKSKAETEDVQAFIGLLKSSLQLNPVGRIKPADALGHDFITLKHFPDGKFTDYVKSSTSIIQNCRLEKP